jgi:CDP-diacylglycerol--serine O-phosphatidyltransferase
MVWLWTDLGWTGGYAMAFACVITPLAGALMVSHFKFYSFKEVKSDTRISFTFALAIPLTIVLVMLAPPKVLFAMAMGYAISGPALTLYLHRKSDSVPGADETDTGSAEDLTP